MKKKAKFLASLAELAAMANNCGNHEEAKKTHEALKADPNAWALLLFQGSPAPGIQKDAGDDFDLELRDCGKCGSTLCKRIYKISTTPSVPAQSKSHAEKS